MSISAQRRAVADAAKGFLPAEEADALREAAAGARAGLWLEIGTYCAKSTVHLGAVAEAVGAHLVTLDHHHGSEENQPGWEWHDPDLVDPHTGALETVLAARHTLHAAGLEATVSLLVASTQQVAPWWSSPLELLFLDGNHTEEVAQHDYAQFARHLTDGGLLLVHDVFPDPRDGGAPPWHVVQRATGSGDFIEVSVTGSLRVLQRRVPRAGLQVPETAGPLT
ncbi:MAG: class I SAM-dependent methyltransferase [Actinomycetia bacterium]|nr:class I SAM-dependent methyltransferase [Actinomycetes bacterium]